MVQARPCQAGGNGGAQHEEVFARIDGRKKDGASCKWRVQRHGHPQGRVTVCSMSTTMRVNRQEGWGLRDVAGLIKGDASGADGARSDNEVGWQCCECE